MQEVLARSGGFLARDIRLLCENETQRDGVVADNGHLALIALLSAGPDSKTTEIAIGALVNLSFQSAARKQRLMQAGVIAPTVALLRTAPTASSETVLQAAILVRNLASAGKDAIQKAGAIAPLVSLLGAAPGIAAQAAAAL